MLCTIASVNCESETRHIHMKFSKLILAIVGATVLLGALVSSASARNFSVSENRNTALWTNMEFAGGIGGPVRCEVRLSGSFHSRTSTKTPNTLLGYITEGTVLRCERGTATIRQESLPWHRRFRNFDGALPNITSQSENVVGAEWTVREPFGITCTVRRESSSTIGTYRVGAGRAISEASVSGESRCGEFIGRLSGTTTNVTNGAGARITVTLI